MGLVEDRGLVADAARSTGDGPAPDRDAGAFDLLRPDPGGTIRSLTALGYTPEAAVADLVDNSIAAGATAVAVDFHWGGADGSTVSVSDDGRGMSETELLEGMTVGGRGLATDRRAGDLGRFGMGLKTASFSQCRQLVVASRPRGGDWSVRTWDVDHVLAVGDWQLLHRPPPAAAARLAELTGRHPGSGTVVLWRHLTRLAAAGSVAAEEWAQREFHRHVARVEQHLGMVFGRYLTRRTRPLHLTVNGLPVAAWDPFLEDSPWVDRLPQEHPVPGVSVRGVVLPHRSRLDETRYEQAGGPRGWLDQQGFYVYRQDRLIVAGGWLGLGFRRDERHKLARLAVHVSTDQDARWSVDVRKSTATPPPALAGHLRRIARATRERAAAVMTHRGRVVMVKDRPTAPTDVTWRQVTQFGRASFRINRTHPLVVDLLTRHPEIRSTLTALLGMVETTLPLELIRMAPDAGPGPVTDSAAAPDEVVEMAGQVLEALVGQGASGQEALSRVLGMPPFDRFPALADQLHEDAS